MSSPLLSINHVLHKGNPIMSSNILMSFDNFWTWQLPSKSSNLSELWARVSDRDYSDEPKWSLESLKAEKLSWIRWIRERERKERENREKRGGRETEMQVDRDTERWWKDTQREKDGQRDKETDTETMSKEGWDNPTFLALSPTNWYLPSPSTRIKFWASAAADLQYPWKELRLESRNKVRWVLGKTGL